MTYAIFRAAGQQFRAQKGDVIRIPKVEGKEGSKITFGDVLLTNSGKKVRAGQPIVKGAAVTAEIVRHGRGEKIIVFRFKRRKNYRKKTGHREQFTEIKVTDVKVGA